MILFEILLFFPSITFGLLSAEIFPWGVFSIVWGPKRYNKKFLLLVAIFILYAIVGWFAEINNPSEVIRSLMAYLNVLFVINFLLVISNKRIEKLGVLSNRVFIFFIFLGVLQYSGVLSPFNSIFSILVPRGSAEVFGAGGRGVSLLSTEPSRASLEIVYLYTYFRLCLKKRKILWDLIIMAYLTIIVRSATGLFLFLIFMMFEYRKYWYLMLIVIIAFLFTGLNFIQNSDSRALQIVVGLAQDITIGGIFLFLLNNSGFRLVSILAAYLFGILHPIGYGIGTWKRSMLVAFKQTGLNPAEVAFFRNNFNSEFSPVRPVSFFANIMIDFGIIGSIIPVLVTNRMLKIKQKINKENFSSFLLFLFTTFLFGAVGNPIPWIVFILALRKKY